MAASLMGKMFELATENCTNDYSNEPMIVTTNNTSDNNKITIDLNINLNVYHHNVPSTNDKEFKLVEF